MKLLVDITENYTEIVLVENGCTMAILSTEKRFELAENAIFLLIKNNIVQMIANDKELIGDMMFDKVIVVEAMDWEVDNRYLMQYWIDSAKENGVKLLAEPASVHVPKNLQKTVKEAGDKFLTILDVFGYHLKKEKIKPTKAQHRWSKEISEIEFTVDAFDSKAKIFWQKRNEMLIKAGATMKKDTPTLKDGSFGFSAKLGQKLREDNKDKFENFVTTQDVILKSVNEVGLFLYFGGTNSWLEIKDRNGKTIDEWTVVK